jgi:hypothetical protein
MCEVPPAQEGKVHCVQDVVHISAQIHHGIFKLSLQIWTSGIIRRKLCLTSSKHFGIQKMARATGLEPATSGVTGRHSNQLSYARAGHTVVQETRRDAVA